MVLVLRNCIVKHKSYKVQSISSITCFLVYAHRHTITKKKKAIIIKTHKRKHFFHIPILLKQVFLALLYIIQKIIYSNCTHLHHS